MPLVCLRVLLGGAAKAPVSEKQLRVAHGVLPLLEDSW